MRVTFIIEGEFRIWCAGGVGGRNVDPVGYRVVCGAGRKKIARRKMFKAVHSCFMLFIPVSAMNRQIK